jgi:hypothetical protein
MYDPKAVDEKKLERDLEAARTHREWIPDYAFGATPPGGRRPAKRGRISSEKSTLH